MKFYVLSANVSFSYLYICFARRREKKKKKEEGDEDTLVNSSGGDENLNILGRDSGYPFQTIEAMANMSEREVNVELLLALLKHIKEKNVQGAVLIFLPGWNVIFSILKFLQMHPIFGKSICLLF